MFSYAGLGKKPSQKTENLHIKKRKEPFSYVGKNSTFRRLLILLLHLYLCALFGLLVHRPDHIADDDQHGNEDGDRSEHIKDGMLLDEDRGNADEEDQDVACDDDDLLIFEAEVDAGSYDESVVNVKAREHIGRRIDRVEIFNKSHKDIVAVRDLTAQIDGVGIYEANDDKERHACHEHVRSFASYDTAPDAERDHAGNEVRKPHRIRDYKAFKYGDLVVQSDVDLMESACGLKALYPEKCRHIEDHINGHREQSQDNVYYLVLKTLVLNNLIHSTLASGYKYAECPGPHPNSKHSHIIP